MTTYDLARRLPAIPELRPLCRALAVLDLPVSPNIQNRCHHYDTEWRAPGEQMASEQDSAPYVTVAVRPATRSADASPAL